MCHVTFCLRSADVVLKLANTAAARLLSNRPALVAAIVIITGAYLTHNLVVSALYDARSTNKGAAALNLLIFLTGCTAEAIALEIGSEVAGALQQAFGAAVALTVAGTLFALTPIGSRLFIDGKMQRIEALSASVAKKASTITIQAGGSGIGRGRDRC